MKLLLYIMHLLVISDENFSSKISEDFYLGFSFTSNKRKLQADATIGENNIK